MSEAPARYKGLRWPILARQGDLRWSTVAKWECVEGATPEEVDGRLEEWDRDQAKALER